jgi:hypothetical protein
MKMNGMSTSKSLLLACEVGCVYLGLYSCWRHFPKIVKSKCCKMGSIASHDTKCFMNLQRNTNLISLIFQLCSNVKKEC